MKKNKLSIKITQKLKRYYTKFVLIIKNFLPKSLYYRTILIVSTTILLVQVVGVVIFYDNHWRHIRSLLVRNITNNIASIVNQVNEAQSLEEMETVLEKFRRYSSLNPQLVIIDDASVFKPINRTSNTLSKEIHSLLPNNPIYINEYGDSFSILKLSVLIRDNMYITFYLEKDMFFTKSILLLAVSMVFLYFLCILITVQFIRLQIRPLYRLSKYAKLFGKGEKIPYIQPSGSIEIKETTIAFNEMTSQIQRFIDQRTMLLSSVSHDLKTSLTKINLILDVNEKTAITDDIKEEVDNMYQMISSYLSFARDDSIIYEKESINIKDFFKSVIKNPNYTDISINLSFEQTSKIIEINPLLFKRALDNIISNALSYANKMEITITNSGNHNLLISIEDDGTGIPEEARELVFRPFYKINEARTASKGSVGLGLYIVKDIITKHGGNIELGDSQYGGLKINITIPL